MAMTGNAAGSDLGLNVKTEDKISKSHTDLSAMIFVILHNNIRAAPL